MWFAIYGPPPPGLTFHGYLDGASLTGTPTTLGTFGFTVKAGMYLVRAYTLLIGTSPPPQVVAIAPSSGAASGGTPIVLTGTGFEPGDTLKVGGLFAGNLVVVSSTEIDASAPPLHAGTLNDVVVLNSLAFARAWLADFLDVPQGSDFHDYVEKIFRDGITAGYGDGYYGVNDPVTRAQMAVFLLKGEHGSDYAPPACAGVFDDVVCTPGAGFPDWIEQLYAENITGGCFADPLRYCPERTVTRAEMAVFLLRGKHGSDYVPPTCTGIFDDVACTPGVGFPDWIERLHAEDITAGCNLPQDPPAYCPDRLNTRGEMAVFLVKTFQLP